MKLLLLILFSITLSNQLFTQGLYCKTNKDTEFISPKLDTKVDIKKGELFIILSSYKVFFLVMHLDTKGIGSKGYVLKNDVTTFIRYDVKMPGSLQSFKPVADTIYDERWNDTTIDKWKKIANECHGKPPFFKTTLDSTLFLNDSL